MYDFVAGVWSRKGVPMLRWSICCPCLELEMERCCRCLGFEAGSLFLYVRFVAGVLGSKRHPRCGYVRFVAGVLGSKWGPSQQSFSTTLPISICARNIEPGEIQGEILTIPTMRPGARHLCFFQVPAPNMCPKVRSDVLSALRGTVKCGAPSPPPPTQSPNVPKPRWPA